MTLSLLRTHSPEDLRIFEDVIRKKRFKEIALLLDRNVVAEFLDDKLHATDVLIRTSYRLFVLNLPPNLYAQNPSKFNFPMQLGS